MLPPNMAITTSSNTIVRAPRDPAPPERLLIHRLTHACVPIQLVSMSSPNDIMVVKADQNPFYHAPLLVLLSSIQYQALLLPDANIHH